MNNAKKWYILAIFRKPETCCQLVLPDGSINDPKLVENAKTPIFKCDILGFFKHTVQCRNFEIFVSINLLGHLVVAKIKVSLIFLNKLRGIGIARRHVHNMSISDWNWLQSNVIRHLQCKNQGLERFPNNLVS